MSIWIIEWRGSPDTHASPDVNGRVAEAYTDENDAKARAEKDNRSVEGHEVVEYERK